jgi:sigma-70-like protein
LTKGANRLRRRAGRVAGIGALALLLLPLWPAQAQVRLPSLPQVRPAPQLPSAPQVPSAPTLPLETRAPIRSDLALPVPTPDLPQPSVDPQRILPSRPPVLTRPAAPSVPAAPAAPVPGSGAGAPASSTSSVTPAGAQSLPATRPGSARAAANGRARRGRARLYPTRFRARLRLVRRFQGCLDVLRARQRTALVLRYGLGSPRVHSVREAARLMHLSKMRVRLLERRGVRRLARAGRRTSCDVSGVGATSLTGTTGAVVTAAFRGAASDAAGSPARGAVAGRQASGGSDGLAAESRPATLTTPFGTIDKPAGPLLIALLAAVVAGIALAGRSLLRSVR